MLALLQVVAGPDQGRTFPLEEGHSLTIGRGQNTSTQLKDPAVSRVHCELQVANGKFHLADNGSAAGTFVNGSKVSECELKPGDLVQIGSTQLRIALDQTHEQETVSPHGPAMAFDPAALVGQTLSNYKIESVIAKGQSGTVFKGLDTKSGKPVAIKVLGPEYTDSDDDVQRFIRAMNTALNLRHDNIVSLLGAGKTGPICWLAMEYVEGEPLTKVIARIDTVSMLDWQYALRVATHIARALEAANAQHIIHRNVTPENILIRKSDNVAKLGDLMFAKALEGVMAKPVTRPGQLVGSIAYMSPERTKENAQVDTRSDIYGLGATVYALLTGRPPFEGASLVDTITKIRSADPVKPTKYQLSIPGLFEGTVLRMIAKRPEDRFQSPRELLADLERVAKFNNVTI